MNQSLQARASRARNALARHGEFLLLVAFCALVYQPWAAPGLPILDFSEFLPKLAAHDSFWGSVRAVQQYLASQGRFSPVQYVYLAGAWKLFGTNAAGWHWTYFIVNAVVLFLARDILLRLGVRRTAALIALAFWAVMKPFSDGWVRPTGETLGLLFLLIGFRAALEYRTGTGWRRDAIIIALCCVAAVLSKEMLVVLIPVLWLVTRTDFGDGARFWRRWDERDTLLTAMLILAAVAALIPVAYVALHAQAGNYAARYGSEPIKLGLSLERFENMAFPGSVRLSSLKRVLADPAWRLLLVLPNLVWLGLLADGLTVRSGRKRSWVLLIGALWMMAGVLAYIPWPGHAVFYMIPFGFGVVLIAAHAMSSLLDQKRSTAVTALIFAGLLLAITSVEARDAVYQHDMRVELDESIIESIARAPGLTSVIAAVPDPAPPGGWGWARKLAEFGRVMHELPAVQSADASCRNAAEILARAPGTVIVSGLEGCGKLSPASKEVSASAPLRMWPTIFERRRLGRFAYVTVTPAAPVGK